MSAVDSSTKVDENLYSRQILLYGMEMMGRLTQLRVLVVGLGGVGVEVAKNLILAGPKAVTIADDGVVEATDLASNYYLNEAHVGTTTRASASVKQLSQLNPYVAVDEHCGAVTEELVSQFNVVVFTRTPRDQLVRFNEFCRSHSPRITFVAADVFGAAGMLFSDFGDHFMVKDKRGEAPKQGLIADVSKGKPATVMLVGGKRNPMEVGEWVKFTEVKGMTELNEQGPFRVTGVSQFGFDIEDTTGFADYVEGGRFEQVFVPEEFSHKSLRHRIVCPRVVGEMLNPELAKPGRPEQLHVALQGLFGFWSRHGMLPTPHDEAHVAEVLQCAAEFAEENKKANEGSSEFAGQALVVDAVDASLVRAVARVAAAQFPPMCAFIGGLAAQEAIKATGKYTPLDQWLLVDMLDALPDSLTGLGAAEVGAVDAAEVAPCGGRDADLVRLLGRSTVDKLHSLRVFLVGAGALGCEFLKNFALLGVGCGGSGGHTTVTDMDNIEVSNLNRQFLFRQPDVGRPKSTCAAAAAVQMNPALTVEALTTAVGPDTEDVFHDGFWGNVDVVVNALDNIKARLYVDGMCVFYGKPLLESGTLGTKCNVQVVLPHRTQSYGDSADPPEASIPLCTLKNFPYQLDHCIEWARDVFYATFDAPARDAQALAADAVDFLSRVQTEGNGSAQRERLTRLRAIGELGSSPSLGACVRRARLLFEELYVHQPLQLLHTFPSDFVDAKGNRFWVGTKRIPQPLAFDASDPVCLLFVHACANMLARIVGIEGMPGVTPDPHRIMSELEGVEVPAFRPRAMRIKADEEDKTEEGGEGDELVAQQLAHELKDSTDHAVLARVKPEEFEKDDDSNHHIDFIMACSNLRARVYSIPEADRHQVKLIAGKIVPAIATTTCAVTGLVMAELVKLVQSKPTGVHRNAFANLAINNYVFSEPMPPVRTVSKEFDPVFGCPIKAVPEGFTPWDKVVVRKGDMTMGELCEHLATVAPGATATMITYGKYSLYTPMLRPKHKERKSVPVSAVIAEATKTSREEVLARRYVTLDAGLEDDDGDVVIPRVLFYFESEPVGK